MLINLIKQLLTIDTLSNALVCIEIYCTDHRFILLWIISDLVSIYLVVLARSQSENWACGYNLCGECENAAQEYYNILMIVSLLCTWVRITFYVGLNFIYNVFKILYDAFQDKNPIMVILLPFFLLRYVLICDAFLLEMITVKVVSTVPFTKKSPLM